jgi:toxin YhaV
MSSDLVRVNGWLLLVDPLFLDQISELENRVRSDRTKYPDTYLARNAAKRLGAIRKLILQVIPANPASPNFRLGLSLGAQNKNWFRAKFFQQYRLYFRFDSKSKIIIYCWVNDDSTLRAYESKSDAYLVFERMLQQGEPPTSWEELLDRASGLVASR